VVGSLRYSPRLGPDVSGGLIQYRYGPIGVNKHAPGCRRCDGAVGRGERGRVWTTGEHNMERRKFVLGVGALAAGGAAAVGSGAFTTSSSDRTVDVNVAADSSGFVGIKALDGTFASGTGDGQLELNFNSDSGLGIFDGDAQGLNPSSTFNFPELFRISNVAGLGDARVIIEASGFDLESLELTAAGDESTGISEGTSLRATDYSDVDSLPKLVQPDSVDVDMRIETKDDSTTGAVGGELIIHVATGGNRDELSDVLS
jgi:hypothetical protein